jgi:outer membrane protein OmpA-like peptidoglycan-associated protein
MLAGIQVGDSELTALGDRRAQAVKQWLQTVGQVEEPRMFLVATKLGAPEGTGEAAPSTTAVAQAGRVEFSLK